MRRGSRERYDAGQRESRRWTRGEEKGDAGQEEKREATLDKRRRASDAEAVSYTHLDVYKRQIKL